MTIVSTTTLDHNGASFAKAMLKAMKDYHEVDFKALRFSDGFYVNLKWHQVGDLILGLDDAYNFTIKLSPEGDEVWVMEEEGSRAMFWAKVVHKLPNGN